VYELGRGGRAGGWGRVVVAGVGAECRGRVAAFRGWGGEEGSVVGGREVWRSERVGGGGRQVRWW